MSAEKKTGLAPLAVTIGEPAGIGPEVILKSWLARKTHCLPVFAVIGGATHLQALSDQLQLGVRIKSCTATQVPDVFDSALPVIAVGDEQPVRAVPGSPQKADADLVTGAIVNAVAGCMAGRFSAIATAPIHKKALYDAGFEFPGHTEFLGILSGEHAGKPFQPVMMLAGPELKTVPVTIHIALEDVPQTLTQDLIAETGKIVASDLQSRLGISAPRLAVSGLNPHAGENGAMGQQDEMVIAPAIDRLRKLGIDAFGPLPADTMFHATARKTYDVALCMYHDQALIPAKTLAFDDAVNVTLGLPFIRTSPDHGTAFDIAGKGVATPSSMIAAIKMAGEMARNSTSSQRDEAGI